MSHEYKEKNINFQNFAGILPVRFEKNGLGQF